MAAESTIAHKTVKIIDIISETADTKSFVLECANGKIDYKTGQFLTFLFTRRNGEKVRRSYSLSSCAELNEPLTITIKRIVNGEYSRYLHDRAMIGDELETIGASGFFILPEQPEKHSQIVFMAAGSGIVPVYALIKSIAYAHPSIKVLLIYSNTTRKNTIFIDKLEKLKNELTDKLEIEFLFSRSPDVFRSRLTSESLEEFLQKHNIRYNGDVLYYVCGPLAYMRMIAYRLSILGVPQSCIKKEIFHVQHPSIRPEPPDKLSHTVMLMRNESKTTFTVQYPQTILQAARLLDIHIPYSCENGQCGSCVARCLHGNVWMAQNEVLLDEDIKKGFILTCTGYPINGDIILTLQS